MSAKTRSMAARPAWNWLQKADRFISGNQNASMLCKNRNQAPMAMAPSSTETAPAYISTPTPPPMSRLSAGNTVASTKPRRRLMP
mgnify:CR=1 FL=1